MYTKRPRTGIKELRVKQGRPPFYINENALTAAGRGHRLPVKRRRNGLSVGLWHGGVDG